MSVTTGWMSRSFIMNISTLFPIQNEHDSSVKANEIFFTKTTFPDAKLKRASFAPTFIIPKSLTQPGECTKVFLWPRTEFSFFFFPRKKQSVEREWFYIGK